MAPSSIGPASFNIWGEIGGVVSGSNTIPMCGYTNVSNYLYSCGPYDAALVDTSPAQEDEEGATCLYSSTQALVSCTDTLNQTSDTLIQPGDSGDTVVVPNSTSAPTTWCLTPGTYTVGTVTPPTPGSTFSTFALNLSGAQARWPAACASHPNQSVIVLQPGFPSPTNHWQGPEGGGVEVTGNSLHGSNNSGINSPTAFVTGAGASGDSGSTSFEGDTQCHNTALNGTVFEQFPTTSLPTCPFPVTPIPAAIAQPPDLPGVTISAAVAGLATHKLGSAAPPEPPSATAGGSPSNGPLASPTPERLTCSTVTSTTQFDPPLSNASLPPPKCSGPRADQRLQKRGDQRRGGR